MFLLRVLFHFWIALLLLWPTMGVMAAPSASRTISVDTTVDDITRNGNCTLREAIQAANTDRRVDRCPAGSGKDTVLLDRGVYTLSLAGDMEDQNQTGDFDITQSVRILGVSKDETILDAARIDRIFDIRNSAGTVEIRNMTLQNGETGRPDEIDPGGALSNHGKALVDQVWFLHNSTGDVMREYGGALANFGYILISNSHFEGNISGTYGAAVGNQGDMTIVQTEFRQNTAVGGTLYAGSGAGGSRGRVTIRTTLFLNNECGPGSTSAIFQEAGSSMSVKNSVFNGNGACDSEVITNSGDLTVRYTTFRNNDGGSGGMIKNYDGRLQFTHSLVIDNQVQAPNGAEVVVVGGRVTLDRLTIANSTGPALRFDNGEARLANSTFTGLSSGSCASAICVNGGALQIDSLTVARNQGVSAGSLVVNGGTVTVHNTLLADSFDVDGVTPVADCSLAAGTSTSLGYNLISRADGSCAWPSATGDLTGALAAPIDPRLDTLKDNGGPTPTLALLRESPAVNAADPLHFFKTDQRMYPRPAGRRADIGAFEYNARPAPRSAESEDAESE